MIIGNVVKKKSHGGGVSISSHLNSGWQGEAQVGELTFIGEVRTDGIHVAWASLIWVTKYFGDVSFVVARKF